MLRLYISQCRTFCVHLSAFMGYGMCVCELITMLCFIQIAARIMATQVFAPLDTKRWLVSYIGAAIYYVGKRA